MNQQVHDFYNIYVDVDHVILSNRARTYVRTYTLHAVRGIDGVGVYENGQWKRKASVCSGRWDDQGSYTMSCAD